MVYFTKRNSSETPKKGDFASFLKMVPTRGFSLRKGHSENHFLKKDPFPKTSALYDFFSKKVPHRLFFTLSVFEVLFPKKVSPHSLSPRIGILLRKNASVEPFS